MRISGELLPTTVVGSYPVVKPPGFRLISNPLKQALETAVSDQIRAGIEIISTGQVRGDMINALTSRLPGIRGHEVIGRVTAPPHPITVADTKYALSRHTRVKGILTGPTTLAHALRVGTPIYRDREELALDIAEALAVEARYLEKAGVEIIQIDEPILSTGAADLDAGRRALNILLSAIHIPAALHTCGEITDIIDDLLKIDVSIFDLEFANNAENIEVISSRDMGGRLVGYGCVDSADPAVESMGEIKKRIETGIDIFGAETLLIDPDCGLRMLTRDAAFGKLKHMVAAALDLRLELG